MRKIAITTLVVTGLVLIKPSTAQGVSLNPTSTRSFLAASSNSERSKTSLVLTVSWSGGDTINVGVEFQRNNFLSRFDQSRLRTTLNVELNGLLNGRLSDLNINDVSLNIDNTLRDDGFGLRTNVTYDVLNNELELSGWTVSLPLSVLGEDIEFNNRSLERIENTWNNLRESQGFNAYDFGNALDVPEPSGILGATAALAFGAYFKNKLTKKKSYPKGKLS